MEDNEARFLRRSDLDDDGDIFCLFHYLVFYWNNSPLEKFVSVTVAVYKTIDVVFLAGNTATISSIVLVVGRVRKLAVTN